MKMTVKEFYEYCKSHNAEDYYIYVDYACGDDWYNYEDFIDKDMIVINPINDTDDEVIKGTIDICIENI